MNPISAFFVRNIVVVFFFYGLAFFVMGLALVFASRRTSEFKFAWAIRPLAGFGLLHGIHEWFEMFQKIAALSSGYSPSVAEELVRLTILVSSFLLLFAFGVALLSPEEAKSGLRYRPLLLVTGLWGLSLILVILVFTPPIQELIAMADVLSRYALGIPAAFLGTWALMAQQRTFREYGMPQFGQDLVWCAAALLLYGIFGQIFVRQTPLVPSNIVNSTLFLQWFGIPVQLFRGVMAAALTFFMVRALRAFELESQQRLERANQAKLSAQAMALEAERRISQEMERLNEELRLKAHELALLLDLSNLLAASENLQNRFQQVLGKIVRSLSFPEAGMLLLVKPVPETVQVQVSTGFTAGQEAEADSSDYYAQARDLGEQCVANAIAMCRHLDGTVIRFKLEEALDRQECYDYQSPTMMISLPLRAQERVIGSLVLAKTKTGLKRLMIDEFKLMMGIAQQMGLSLENARLYQEAQRREQMLGELLHQVVGAQETERQRIARELHDATGQSLTAVALGLRGVEAMVASGAAVEVDQIKELKNFSMNALGELRQIIADLRPPQLDDLGLVAALKWYVQAFEKRRAIQTEFVMKGEPVRLPSEYETVLFRITQEALTNIAKHAQASRATVILETHPLEVQLEIKDDGVGFDLEAILEQENRPVGWGLLGIRERTLLLGGHYEINTSPGQGTRICVSVPVMMETEDVEDKVTTG